MTLSTERNGLAAYFYLVEQLHFNMKIFLLIPTRVYMLERHNFSTPIVVIISLK